LKKSENNSNDKERKKIEEYMRGDINSKIAAIKNLFLWLKKDPDYSLTKLKILANKTQPDDVRLFLAQNMNGKGLTTKQYFDLLKTLSQDPDKKLLEFIKKRNLATAGNLSGLYSSITNAALENLKFQSMSEMWNLKSVTSVIDDLNRNQWRFMDNLTAKQLEPFNFSQLVPDMSAIISKSQSAIEDLIKKQQSQFHEITAKQLEPFNFSQLVPDMSAIISKSQSAIEDLIKKQQSQFENLSTKYLESVNDSYRKEFLKGLTETQTKWLDKASIFDSAKPLLLFVQLNDMALRPITEQIKRTPSYYAVQELEPVSSPPSTPVTKKAKDLLAKLKNCDPGIDNWVEYQDICMEILSYCLVPPLLDPTEQSNTQDRSHRRDLIYHIPHGAGPFWSYLTLKYGLGIIVDCKNYRDPLRENEMIITSKYFEKKKLTTLGLVISRKGLSTNGLKAQQDLWRDQEKMLLCLDDNDMAKMLELKDRGEEPWKIIDLKEREFRLSF